MPYYEVELVCTKPVCIKAENESEAEALAEDLAWSDANRAAAEVMNEIDETKDAKIIQEYKDEGNFAEQE